MNGFKTTIDEKGKHTGFKRGFDAARMKIRSTLARIGRRHEPPPVITKDEPKEKPTLRGYVLEPGNAGKLFANSPLGDQKLEETVLRQAVMQSTGEGIRLLEVRLGAEHIPEGHSSWGSYINSCSSTEGKPQIRSHLLVASDGQLMLSDALVGFMEERIAGIKGELSEPLTLRQVLKTGFDAVSIFRSSPLQDSRLEAQALGRAVHMAVEAGIPLEQVRFGKDMIPAGSVSWQEWLDAYGNVESGKPGIKNHLLVTQEGELRLSSEIIAFMRLRIRPITPWLADPQTARAL